jgi:hypothetical protein
VTLYLAIFDNVLHRLRFSKFLSVVRVDIPEVVYISLIAIILFMLLHFKIETGIISRDSSSLIAEVNME